MRDENNIMPFTDLFAGKEMQIFFATLRFTTNFDLQVYSKDGSRLSGTEENDLCGYVRSLRISELKCPESCRGAMTGELKEEGPAVYKCAAGLTCFSFLSEHSGEEICVTGRGGFESYEDLLEMLRIIKTHNFPALPASAPLEFTGKDQAKAIADYVSLFFRKLLSSYDERSVLEEKFYRMTSLFDSSTFEALSRNQDLLYRYILDTIEFIFGPTSAVFMTRDYRNGIFRSVHSTERYRDHYQEIRIEVNSPLIQPLLDGGTYVSSENIRTSVPDGALRKAEHFCFLPINVDRKLEKLIGIFDRKLLREDLKIMNAFRDYLQLNFENRNLRDQAGKLKKADERFAYFVDFSNTIMSILSKERLFHSLVEKSLQLLNAEQGSIMLLDQDTSELVVEAKKSSDDIVQERMRLRKEDSIAAFVLDSGEPLLVDDIEKDPRVRRENRPRYRTKSFISILIKVDERVTGVLNVSDKARGEAFTDEDLKLLQSFVNSAAIAIERSLLHKQAEELKQLSITDPLTGIYNRRYLNHRLSEEITRYNRYKHPFSFMMLDLDKFKEYNDTFGHMSGDRLIRALATIMEKSLRNIDIAARFGGDEFVAIFPQTAKADAIHITNRLKEKIDRGFLQEGFEMPMTISMGLTTFPDDASSVGELLEKTDQALYLAKKGGGDKVVYL